MKNNLEELAKIIRYYSLTSTTAAGSGHPTSSLSAADLMTVLFYDNFFKYDLSNPENPYNDRLIFSKGHASPLFYSLWATTGAFPYEELLTLRKFGSRLEGHPTRYFPFTETNTGSLGQGLSVGAGMALQAKYLDKLDYRTYIVLGDSEIAEGSNWEAAAFASHYKLNNLIAIVDVNRLGQTGETMYGWQTDIYEERFKAFGWNTIVIDGHDFTDIHKAYKKSQSSDKPFAIIAKTIKGKGVSFIEDKPNWHGKALKNDELKMALKELGNVNINMTGKLTVPVIARNEMTKQSQGIATPSARNDKQNVFQVTSYKLEDLVATRKAYGNGLVNLGKTYNDVIVLDAETQNSTFSELFEKAFPERFFEMFIAEQNMVGVATGLARRNKIPFVSTFTAFFTRAFDQIRMSQYSQVSIKYIGSHAGVSIGEDGSSQMGLEDLAMFSSLLNSVVLYPSDAISTEKLTLETYNHDGIVYMRTTRMETPIIYSPNEEFPIGGSKIVKQSKNDVITVIGAGVTLHEALKAYEKLKEENINIRVVDLYSIKPIDVETLKLCSSQTKAIITVEDHYPHGGIGSAVTQALASEPNSPPIYILAVNKMPRSGKPQELLDYEEISSTAIVKKVKEILS